MGSNGKIKKRLNGTLHVPKEWLDKTVELAKKEIRRRFWKRFFVFGSVIFVILFGLFLDYFQYPRDLPSPDELAEFVPKQTSLVYSADQKPIYGFFDGENRRLVTYDQIPPRLREAILAAEDKNFFGFFSRNIGFDPLAIVRAFITNQKSSLSGGPQIKSGGSGLQAQNVRRVWGEAKKMYRFSRANVSLQRKFDEIRMVYQLRHYPREDMFALYANLSYEGDGRYGVERAAWKFCHRRLDELWDYDDPEVIAACALLAGLIKNPSDYSPIYHPNAALGRRHYVLTQMLKNGFIDDEMFKRASNESLPKPRSNQTEFFSSLKYPIEHTKAILKNELNLGFKDVWHGGLDIHTTVDMRLQKIVEIALKKQIDLYNREWVKHSGKDDGAFFQGAVVILENKNPMHLGNRPGAIRAMVGGYDFADTLHNGNFNRTVQAFRQLGSLFKPIVYLSALERGKTPYDMVCDCSIVMPAKRDKKTGRVIKWWRPQNYPVKGRPPFWGNIRMVDALVNSRNLAAINTANALGEEKRKGIEVVIQMAYRLGINLYPVNLYENKIVLDPYLPTAIGAVSVRPIDIATVYSVFANQGRLFRPYLVESVSDKKGRHNFRQDIKGYEVVSSEKITPLVAMLRNVTFRGTAASLTRSNSPNYLVVKAGNMMVDIPVAGKTGTTNDFKDAWFGGITGSKGRAPSYTIVVWVGFDQPNSMSDWITQPTGGKLALPIFAEIVRGIYSNGIVNQFSDAVETLAKDLSK